MEGATLASPEISGYLNHQSLQDVKQQQYDAQQQLNQFDERLERIEKMLSQLVPTTQITDPQQQGIMTAQKQELAEHVR
ncbi:MAG: hypothetical protein EAY76_01105 [Alphaproteobacteria bacterium]|nr:MAG: hypothetical protein EAY76_01105 [Alphaproteobacteria bacterium]TAF76980.1 MAG: hypothetical protein EAZ52_02345 [Alphaproteobacteria bacterium]